MVGEIVGAVCDNQDEMPEVSLNGYEFGNRPQRRPQITKKAEFAAVKAGLELKSITGRHPR